MTPTTLLSGLHRTRAAASALVLVLAAGCGTTLPYANSQGGGFSPGAETGLSAPGTPSGIGATASSQSTGGGLGGSAGRVPTSGPKGAAERVTTPLTLGVLYPDLGDAFTVLGMEGQGGAALASDKMIGALVRHYNARGGIAGRQIRLIPYSFKATDSSWDIHYQAACSKFTEDNKADVVISIPTGVTPDNYETCLANAGVPNIKFAGFSSNDDHDYAKYRSLISVGAASLNREITAVLTGLSQRGSLTTSNKVGVLVMDCPQSQRTYDTTFEPLARRLGLTVLRRDVDCIHGFSDIGRVLAQAGAAVLPFNTAGVDRVAFVSTFEAGLLIAFSQEAESQGYRPWYMLTSNASLATQAPNYPSNQLPRMIGVGELPHTDASAVPTNAASKRCRGIFASQGIRPASKPDYATLDGTCAPFFLLEAALLRSSGDSRLSVLVPSIDSLGTSYVSPINLDGATSYDARRHDGTRLFAVFGYQEGCSCFVYLSKPARMA